MFPVYYSFRSRDGADGGLSAEEGDYVERFAPNGDAGKGGGARQPAQAAQNATNKRGQRAAGLAQIAADRPIFTLSVAADLLGLHPRTLRIYEEKGLVIPSRTEGNRRRYSQNDIQRFQFIRQLTRTGVNLEGVRIILDMADELTRLGGDPATVIERSSSSVQVPDEP
jgi:MerR family transcriptional regulator/heat shock protein HspR